MTPTDTLVAKRAMISPLMARKAATRVVRKPPAGNQHRRPAGPPGHDPGADHGQPRPGDDQPGHDQQATGEIGFDLGAGAAADGRPPRSRPARPPRQPGAPVGRPGRLRRHPPGHARAAKCAPGAWPPGPPPRPARGTPITTSRMSTGPSERSPGANGSPVKATLVKAGPDQKEHAEAEGDAAQRGHTGFHGRDHRNLPGRGAHQAHGGEALLPAGGGQPGGGADEDQHREQQGQRPDGQDDLELVGVPTVGPVHPRIGVDAGHLARPRDLGQLLGGVTDDDDQGVRGRQGGRADGADLGSREAIAQLGRRHRAKEPAEGRRGVVLTRPGQTREPGGTGESGPVAATSTRSIALFPK